MYGRGLHKEVGLLLSIACLQHCHVSDTQYTVRTALWHVCGLAGVLKEHVSSLGVGRVLAIGIDLGDTAANAAQGKCDCCGWGTHADSTGLLWGGYIFYWVTCEAGKAALL